MLIGLSVICCSLLYSVMVYIIYLHKRKINSIENRCYNFLLKISIIGLFLELCCMFFIYNMDVSLSFKVLNIIINKAFLIYLLTWEMAFTIYMFCVSFFQHEVIPEKLVPYKKKISFGILLLYITLVVMVILLPTYYHNDGTYIYSDGPATSLLLLFGGICIGLDIYFVCKNIKKINKKKYYPLVVLILLMLFVFVLRNINPGLTIINSVFAFVAVLMYFTIENPDLQVLMELSNSKKYAEESNDKKSNFLYQMIQNLKEPVQKMDILGREALEECKNEQIKEKVVKIKGTSKEALLMVNNMLDISDVEQRKISIACKKYQLKRLFQELSKQTEAQIQNKPIEFHVSYEGIMPEYVMGDSLRLKQIVGTLLDNALLHTKQGFIKLSIQGVVKHDIYRMTITVEDSGKGISVTQLGNLFSKKNNSSQIDDAQENLAFVKTLSDLMGGVITVNSELEKGSKFTFTIDQKITENEIK